MTLWLVAASAITLVHAAAFAALGSNADGKSTTSPIEAYRYQYWRKLGRLSPYAFALSAIFLVLAACSIYGS